jgi:putative ABC transport system permease protein
MRASFGRQLAGVPGVEAVTPTRVLPVRIAPASLTLVEETGDNLIFNAIDPHSYRQVGDIEFAANQGDPQQNWARLEQGRAVFISNTMADRYHLQQGDTLSLLTARGAQPFTVAAEVMDFTGQGRVIYGTYTDLQRWFAEEGVDRFTIKVSAGVPVATVSDEIEARYKDRRHVSVQTTEAFKGSILDLVNQAFRLFDVLNLIGVIIGVIGVINTLTMNVLERQQEIGGLRSLGMIRSQVLRMVLAEALALGVMGGVYGLVFGYVLANVMILGLNLMVGYDLSYLFTPRPYLLGVLIALVVVQFAALSPARRAARVNIVEAIKHE